MSNFVLSAEWQRQSAINITWPHKYSDWQHELVEIEKFYIQLATIISQYQSLIINVYDESHALHVQKILYSNINKLQNINICIVKTNDIWVRDYGCISAINYMHNTQQWHKFCFNGWGKKFDATHDNKAAKIIYENFKINNNAQLIDNENYILEGGSIDTNGKGILLTTAKCLLNPNRQIINKDVWKNFFKEKFGIQEILWLHCENLIGDDTDAHIDMLAKFCNENTIVYSSCNDVNNINYTTLKKLEMELNEIAKLKNYNLISLDIPKKQIIYKNNILPASYINFVILNDIVIMPSYGDENDEINQQKLQNIFIDKKVLSINALVPIRQGGAIHCLTMQYY